MIFSIGHSTLAADAFGKLLVRNNIDVLMDVRSHPTSRWEQFRIENMRRWLPAHFGVAYEWEPCLGGWTSTHMRLADEMALRGVDIAAYSKGKFPKQRIAPDRKGTQEPSWTNQGLYDYSWFTTLEEFHDALATLSARAADENIAIMCCEALWWKCHRSMVADVLAFHGVDVQHIPGKKTHMQCLGNRIERYHPAIVASWRKHPLT